MVWHGFGETRVGSNETPDDVAIRISKEKETIYAHVVEGKPPSLINVVWEFDPERLGMHAVDSKEERMKILDELLKKINQIPGVHKGKTQLYTILRSYKKGKLHPKPHDYGGEPQEST